jgi:hypothetical protein
MPLKFPTPPQGGKAAVIKGLEDAAGTPSALRAGAGQPSLQIMEPYSIYAAGLGDIISSGLGAARLIGWRYLIVEGQNVVQAADISAPQEAGGVHLSSLTTGHAREMEDVLREAEGLTQVAQGDYEIRTLRAPSLYVTALWLKNLSNTRDLFIVVPPVFPPFRAHQVYDQDEFLKLLKAAAAKKIQQRKSP